MTTIKYVILLAGAATLFSCEKAQHNIHKLTGVYNVEKIEVAHYTSGVLDSTSVEEHPGEICLYDNDSEIYNNIYNTMSHDPMAWTVNGVSGGAAGWYTNAYDKINSITFFTEGTFNAPFATYTILKFNSHSKMEWRYIQRDTYGAIDWVETITVKRQR